MLHHVGTFNLGSAKVCSPAIFETYFYYHIEIWISATDYYVLLPNCAIAFDSYTSTNEFYNFIIFSKLINFVVLLVNCLVLIFY